MQEADCTEIPDDVRKRYCSLHAQRMASGRNEGAVVFIGWKCGDGNRRERKPGLFEKYLGMRCEYKDMSEIIRRVENGIYDKEEFKRALAWVKEKLQGKRRYI